MSPKTKLILSADDFGVVDSIDDGIIHLVELGLINSVEVLCNYGNKGKKSLRKTLQLIETAAKANRVIELGVHLTITSGSPLTDPSQLLEVLVPGTNRFVNYQHLHSIASVKASKQELLEQTKVLLKNDETAPFVTHLSNHHDALWFYPNYTKAYIEVAKELNLPVRNPRSYPPYRTWAYYSLKNKLKLNNEEVEYGIIQRAYELRKHGFFPGEDLTFCTTDYMDNRFYSVQDHLLQVYPQDLKRTLRNKTGKLKRMFEKAVDIGPYGKRNDLVEFMFHVRKGKLLDSTLTPTSDLPFYSGIDTAYFDGRTIEYKTLVKNKEYILKKLNSPTLMKGSWLSCEPFTLFKA